MQHCRELGVTSPIAIIPNPVQIAPCDLPLRDGRFRLGYLGRLSPRKNVESLIYAFAELGEESRDAELLIIGGGDREYEDFLRAEVSRLSLTNVEFAGFLSGDEKQRAIESLTLVAMPSEFENLGNVVLEALVHRIPVIATKGSPWSELVSQRCGWWVEYRQDAITEALHEALMLPREELVAMGERGRELMERSYSMEAVGSKMKRLYDWVVGRGDRPEFVYEQS